MENRMTQPSDLIALGEAHRDNASIDAVLTAIADSQIKARVALGAMEQQVRTLRDCVDFMNGFTVAHDNTDTVVTAVEAATSMSVIAAHLATLAKLLEQAGDQHPR